MLVRLENILSLNDKIAVAVSGGCDSMCLLHFLHNNSKQYGFSVIALNVEHGIRGKSSIADTEFVKNYCAQNNIKLLTYSVNAPKYATEHKLSIEQAARVLRYECFEKAIASGECDKIATAHHRDDNVETVLFNIFRGTGLKGLTGILKERDGYIIRPFLSLDRAEIGAYAKTNNIPFVTDETNLSDDYTRNFIRHNVVPKIKEIFPELNQSVERLSVIASEDDEYINSVAQTHLAKKGDTVSIALPCPNAVMSRAIIFALKAMGVKKDWEKPHVESIIDLASLANGARISLLQGVTAIKEYDHIVFFRSQIKAEKQLNFKLGEFVFQDKIIKIKQERLSQIDLKSGLFADLNKIPNGAVIRTRQNGDKFTKFGGGTKSLNDYLTDKKIPLRKRDGLALLADDNTILAIFGLAISEKIKIDEKTQSVISLTIKNNI